MTWRHRLLWLVFLGTWSGYAGVLLFVPPRVRVMLGLFTCSLAIGVVVVGFLARKQLSLRHTTTTLALGSIVHLGITLLLVLGDRLGELGPVPTLARHWQFLTIGIVGLVAAVAAWVWGRPRPPEAVPRSLDPEPAPRVVEKPDWQDLDFVLQMRGDLRRQRNLAAFQRLDAILDGDQDAEALLVEVRRALHQEAQRLETESAADERAQDADVLGQVAELMEWGVQKLPELKDMDLSDLIMGKVIADIRAKHDRVEHIFVDHRRLHPIHPISRASADEKVEERAEAARRALPLLEANGMRMSEELVAAEEPLAPFASVTGFQVVEVGDGFVTFEGNGRREALQRAFGTERGVLVEVRRFCFDDPADEAKIRRRVRRVQRWKGVPVGGG